MITVDYYIAMPYAAGLQLFITLQCLSLQELVSACAELNSRDAVQELTEAMAGVSGAHLTLTQMLDQQSQQLQVSLVLN